MLCRLNNRVLEHRHTTIGAFPRRSIRIFEVLSLVEDRTKRVVSAPSQRLRRILWQYSSRVVHLLRPASHWSSAAGSLSPRTEPALCCDDRRSRRCSNGDQYFYIRAIKCCRSYSLASAATGVLTHGSCFCSDFHDDLQRGCIEAIIRY